MRLASAFMALAALTAAGCGARSDEDGDRDPSAPEGEKAALFVEQRRSDRAQRSGSRYIEGFVPYVEVVAGAGETVLDKSLPAAPEEGSLVAKGVRPGSYRITSYVRPGAGADRLDPPTDRCSTRFGVDAAEAVTATVVREPGRKCQIELDRTTFDDLVGEDVGDARAIAERRGFSLRVVERDGEPLPVTLDLRLDRLNVAEEDGRVSELRGIF